jgi:hypothetical protein
MGPSSDQIERQIAEVRGSMESKIVELRERSRRQVRLASRTALVAVGVGAAVGVAVVGGVVAYRLLRPPTARERLRRLLPWGLAGLPLDARHAGRRAARRLGRRVPSVRLYIGDRQVGEEPAAGRWERIAVRAAQAAGTAAASALASRLIAGLRESARNRQ